MPGSLYTGMFQSEGLCKWHCPERCELDFTQTNLLHRFKQSGSQWIILCQRQGHIHTHTQPPPQTNQTTTPTPPPSHPKTQQTQMSCLVSLISQIQTEVLRTLTRQVLDRGETTFSNNSFSWSTSLWLCFHWDSMSYSSLKLSFRKSRLNLQFLKQRDM